jgi:hypothetical protein
MSATEGTKMAPADRRPIRSGTAVPPIDLYALYAKIISIFVPYTAAQKRPFATATDWHRRRAV